MRISILQVDGGEMIIPVGPNGGSQELLHILRVGSGLSIERDFKVTRLMSVRYVPLVER